MTIKQQWSSTYSSEDQQKTKKLRGWRGSRGMAVLDGAGWGVWCLSTPCLWECPKASGGLVPSLPAPLTRWSTLAIAECCFISQINYLIWDIKQHSMVRDSPISHWQWSPFFLVVVSWMRGKTNKVDSLDSLFYAFYSINSVISVHLQKLTVKTKCGTVTDLISLWTFYSRPTSMIMITVLGEFFFFMLQKSRVQYVCCGAHFLLKG